MIKVIIGGFIVLLTLFSCNKKVQKNNSNEKKTHSQVLYEHSLLKENIITKGDTISYKKLYELYENDNKIEDMFVFSMTMANKYKYPKAYFDVFDILIGIPLINNNENIDQNCYDTGYNCLDEETKKIAIIYLKEAVYKGDLEASNHVVNYYNKGLKSKIKEIYSDKILIEKALINLKLASSKE